MRRTAFWGMFVATALSSLSACGGSTGGEIVVNSTPPPPPSAPPTGSNPVNVFPSVKTSMDFASLGYQLTGNSAAPLNGDGFSIRYDAVIGKGVVGSRDHNAGISAK